MENWKEQYFILYEQITKLRRDTQLLTTLCKDGSYYTVSSIYTLDNGYETMVFMSDEKGKIFDFNDLDYKHYQTYEEMKKGHKEMVAKWEGK